MGISAYVPGMHRSQAVKFTLDALPGVHMAHTDIPSNAANVPGEHWAQKVELSISLKNPELQFVQLDDFMAVEYVPNEHCPQALAVPVEKKPGLHSKQLVCIEAEENVPCSQEIQTLLPTALLKNPELHE